jgi:hypothetical protein
VFFLLETLQLVHISCTADASFSGSNLLYLLSNLGTIAKFAPKLHIMQQNHSQNYQPTTYTELTLRRQEFPSDFAINEIKKANSAMNRKGVPFIY